MEDTIRGLKILIETYYRRFLEVDESALSAKPRPDKWSRKEVIGHLVDSAHNNLRRFICGRYEEPGNAIVYNPDFWVKANHYQNLDSRSVIDLGKMMNDQVRIVLAAMPEEAHTRKCNTSFTGVDLHELGWLAKDYVKHLKHHLNQVFPGEFNVTYESK